MCSALKIHIDGVSTDRFCMHTNTQRRSSKIIRRCARANDPPFRGWKKYIQIYMQKLSVLFRFNTSIFPIALLFTCTYKWTIKVTRILYANETLNVNHCRRNVIAEWWCTFGFLVFHLKFQFTRCNSEKFMVDLTQFLFIVLLIINMHKIYLSWVVNKKNQISIARNICCNYPTTHCFCTACAFDKYFLFFLDNSTVNIRYWYWFIVTFFFLYVIPFFLSHHKLFNSLSWSLVQLVDCLLLLWFEKDSVNRLLCV